MGFFNFGKKRKAEDDDIVEIEIEENKEAAESKPAVDPEEIDNSEVDEALLYMRWGNSEENMKRLLGALTKATVWFAAEKAAQQDPNNAPQQMQVVPKFLKSDQGSMFLPVFTGKKHSNLPKETLMLKGDFAALCGLISRDANTPIGVVVNPASDNYVIPADVVKKVAPQQQTNTAGTQKKGSMLPVDVNTVPAAVKNVITQTCSKFEEINRVWMQSAIQNGQKNMVLLYDMKVDQARAKEIFGTMALAMKPLNPNPLGQGLAIGKALEMLEKLPTIYSKL